MERVLGKFDAPTCCTLAILSLKSFMGRSAHMGLSVQSYPFNFLSA